MPSATALLRLLQRHHLRWFTTADLRTLAGMTPSATAQALRRLAAQELVVRFRRGLWALAPTDGLSLYEAVPYLAAPWPAYVSLYSALADAGVVEEIPHVVYAVTAGRPMRLDTALGPVHLHHLPARFLWGYQTQTIGQARYPIADSEKAFLDLLYLSLVPRTGLRPPPRRHRRWPLDPARLRRYAARFRYPPLIRALRTLGL